MQIYANIYRLKSSNAEIQQILDYNFFDYQDSSNQYFWRYLYDKIDRTDIGNNFDLIGYYKSKTDELQALLQESEDTFSIDEIDISKYINSYTSEQTLKAIQLSQTIEFKQGFKTNIKENDLVIIEEETESGRRIVFIGFIVSATSSIDYGEFNTVNAIVANIGYLYNIAKISAAPTGVSVAAGDYKELEVSVFQHIFADLDIFKIIEKIYKGYFFGGDPQITGNNKYQFAFDFNAFTNPPADQSRIALVQSFFNVMFSLLKVLQKTIEYRSQNEKYAKYSFSDQFIWAEIEHGNHRAYNAFARQISNPYNAEFMTTETIFDDIIKNAMYDFFIDYNGKAIIRPPLYNYLPMDMLKSNEDNEGQYWTFIESHRNYIKAEIMKNESFEYDNYEVKTRTDAKWVSDFMEVPDFYPPFTYVDVPGLIKYGFRNDEPYTNPNAVFGSNLPFLLAIMSNMIVNFMSRKLTFSIKLSNLDRFKIGELYYIEKLNMVGYLTGTTRTVTYGGYPEMTLIFSFLRTVDPLVQVTEANVYDILNMYKRYGVYEDITIDQLNGNTSAFNSAKQNSINKFKEKIGMGSRVPGFKLVPTILDFIELTDGGKANANDNASARSPYKKQTVLNNYETAANASGQFLYRSFAIKLENFFKPSTKTTSDIPGASLVEIVKFTDQLYKSYITTKPVLDFENPKAQDIYNNIYVPAAKQNNWRITRKSVNYNLYNSARNLDIWKFPVPFKYEKLKNISQKLLNRIVECDKECKRQFPFTNYAIPNRGKGGSTEDMLYVAYRTSPFFQTEGFDLSNWTIAEKYKYYPNSKVYEVHRDGKFVISPLTTFNMEFLLNSDNLILAAASSQDSQNAETVSGETRSKLYEAHKQGRAIDVMIPKPGSYGPLYLDKELYNIYDRKVINTVKYTQDFHDYVKSKFQRYFDVVIETPQTIQVYKDDSDIDPFNYEVNIYHLEINGSDYLDINAELLNQSVI